MRKYAEFREGLRLGRWWRPPSAGTYTPLPPYRPESGMLTVSEIARLRRLKKTVAGQPGSEFEDV